MLRAAGSVCFDFALILRHDCHDRRYRIAAFHGAGPANWGKFDALGHNMGFAFVLKWTSQSVGGGFPWRPVPSRFFTHTAPIAYERTYHQKDAWKVVDGSLDSYTYGWDDKTDDKHEPRRFPESERPAAIIVDLGYSYKIESVLLFSSRSTLKLHVWAADNQDDLWRSGSNATHCGGVVFDTHYEQYPASAYPPEDGPELGGIDKNTNTPAGSLGWCTGECDKDADCAPGLNCFQRGGLGRVPGCKGQPGINNWDYCVKDNAFWRYPPKWTSRLAGTVNCSGKAGRYLRIGNAEITPGGYFRLYDIRVKGRPLRQSKQQPTINHWPTRPPLVEKVIPEQEYLEPFEGMHRVYATSPTSDNINHYSSNTALYNQYYGGNAALQEVTFDDGRGWRLSDYTTGMMVLDLGQEHSVAGMRFLNTHGAGNRGTKTLRIDHGHLGPEVSLPIKHVVTNDDLARGATCISKIGLQPVSSGSKHRIKEIKNIPVIRMCQKECQKHPECILFRYRGAVHTCYLVRHVSDLRFTYEYHSQIGPRQCPSTLASNGTTLEVERSMQTWYKPAPKPGNHATWYTTSIPGWRPSNPSLAVDSDPKTCFQVPAGEDVRAALVFDLGSTQAIDAVTINSGMFDMGKFSVYAGATLESVGAGANGSYAHMPMPETGQCNGGRYFELRYGLNNEHYVSNYLRPSAKDLRVACHKETVRYIAIWAMERRSFYQFCDVKVLHRSKNTWELADRIHLDPNFHLRHVGRKGEKSSSGSGPWVEHKFEAPITTRYLRLAVEEYYKMYGGLAAVEIWSDKPVPRFQIKNEHTAGGAQPGLRLELYRHAGGIKASKGRMDWRSQVGELVKTVLPGSQAVVPTVNFRHLYYSHVGTNGEKGMAWEVDVSAQALVGASSATTKQVTIKFEVPFTVTPAVTVELHRKHKRDLNSGTQNVSKALETYMDGFDVSVLAVRKDSFDLRIKRNDDHPWDMVKDMGRMPLSVDYRARAPLPPYRDYIMRPAEEVAFPTKNWTYYFNSRFTGELVADKTAEYTIYLACGGGARVLINGTEFVSAFQSAHYVAKTKYNSTLKANVVISDDLRLAEAKQTIKLEKGKPVSIEIQTTDGTEYGAHVVKLEWSRAGTSRGVIPASAFQHKPRDLCLSLHGSHYMLYTQVCNKSNVEQLWRIDGGFLRPGRVYEKPGGTNRICIRSDNTPYTDKTNPAWSKPVCTSGFPHCSYILSSCDQGGYAQRKVIDRDYMPSKCAEVLKRPHALWSIEPDSKRIRSLNTLAEDAYRKEPCRKEYAKCRDGSHSTGWCVWAFGPIGSQQSICFRLPTFCNAANFYIYM